MQIRVIQDRVPYVGARGDVREMKDRDARLLILLHKVEQVVDQPAASSIESSAPLAAREGYDRRDMRAEKRPKRAKRPKSVADAPT